MFVRLLFAARALPICLMACILIPTGAAAITRGQAISTATIGVIDTLPDKDAVNAYCVQAPIAAGTLVTEATGSFVALLGSDSWLVWIDRHPNTHFEHETKFVLINDVTGVIDLVADGSWWPQVGGVEIYADGEDRGTSLDLFLLNSLKLPPRIPDEGKDSLRGSRVPESLRMNHRIVPKTATDIWGIAITPYDSTRDHEFGGDIRCALETFDSLGVTNASSSVHRTKAQTLADIDAIPNGCDKLYVFWTGHGSADTLWFPGGGFITAKDFACKLKDQGAKEYCVIVEACHSGSLLDELAEKGVNGFHMMATDSATSSHYFHDGSWFPAAAWDCLQSGLRGIEAFTWADSIVHAIIDSVKAGPDSTRWKRWTNNCKNNNTTGGYTHQFGSALGESFCFEVAAGCSTVCIRFPGGASSDTCGNFTLQCEVSGTGGNTWVASGVYNWNLGKSIYFRTYGLPNATGKYKIVMHSNKPGVRTLITWLRGTSQPVTPVTPGSTFNNHSIGWADGDNAEFSDSLGFGTFGNYSYQWFNGTLLSDVPGTIGPNWFQGVQVELPMEPDFARPYLYNGNDPLLGYLDNTYWVMSIENLVDPFIAGADPGSTFVNVTFQQQNVVSFDFVLRSDGSVTEGGGGKAGRDITVIRPGEGEVGGSESREAGKSASPFPLFVAIDLGTIFPEPMFVGMAAFGPGAIQMDANLLLPGELIANATDVDPATPAPAVTHSRLHANEPNPFNPVTKIRFDLAEPGHVRVDVYSLSGRHVRTLLDAHRGAGVHEISWDGRTDSGEAVRSGVYFYRMEAADGALDRKMILVR